MIARGADVDNPMTGNRTIYINRAPVLTLWATVVAERLGFRRDEALTLGRAVAGLNAYSKGVSLGLFHPSAKSVKEHRKKLMGRRRLKVDVLRRAVPVARTPDGLRASRTATGMANHFGRHRRLINKNQPFRP